MATTFFCLSYEEWENPFQAKEWSEKSGKEWLMIKHEGELLENGEVKKSHYHTLVRTGNDMTISAFCKNTGLDSRWVRERNNWQETARYMVHESDSAKEEGKIVFPLESLQGNLVEKAKKYILKKRNKKPKCDDDKGIIQILDYIETFDYLTTQALVRWCCQEGLYSVYRRAGRIISDCLVEHNRNCQFTLQDTLYQMRLEQMEKRMTEAEKELEKVYGDFWSKQENPFNGRVIDKDVEFTKSVKDMMKKIKEIEEAS